MAPVKMSRPASAVLNTSASLQVILHVSDWIFSCRLSDFLTALSLHSALQIPLIPQATVHLTINPLSSM